MVELATKDLWSLFLFCFVLGGVVLFIVLKALGALEPCKHEWEKVIDTCGKGGCGKVVIYRCKYCGKQKRYEV